MKTARPAMQIIRPLTLACLCITLVALTVTLSARPAHACCPPPPRETIENIDEYLTQTDLAYNADPNNPEVVYRCARAHLLAAVHRTPTLTISTYNDLQDYTAPVVTGTYLSAAQAADHCRRANELLARLEGLQPDFHAVWMARGFLLEHCSQDLDLTPAGLSPLGAEETARWQAVIGELDSPVAATRLRAYRQLAAAGDTVLPVLATAADRSTLNTRTQVRALIQACYREQALANYRRAYELYTAAARDQEATAFYAQRQAAGNACLRLIRLHAIAKDEQQFVRSFEKWQKRMNRKYSQTPVDQPCEVEAGC